MMNGMYLQSILSPLDVVALAANLAAIFFFYKEESMVSETKGCHEEHVYICSSRWSPTVALCVLQLCVT